MKITTNIFTTKIPNLLEIVIITPELIKLVYRTMLSKRDRNKVNSNVTLFIEYFKNNSNDIFHSVK